jgi:hypothetical protein
MATNLPLTLNDPTYLSQLGVASYDNTRIYVPTGYTDEYINQEFWENRVVINGNIINFPISITNMTAKNRIFEYPVESGLGNGLEFSGRDPYSFTINIKILDDTTYTYESSLNLILNLLNTSVNEQLTIVHPLLLQHGINQFYVLGWSKTDIDRTSEINISCKEYRDNFVEFLGSFIYENDEQDINNNLNPTLIDEFTNYLESLS